jgi:glycosyltransferase involved in cell wall biosynthesis
LTKIKPLLTIAIPSNNKTELLCLAIGSIVSQLRNEIDCEICISDNSIGNSTEVLIREKYSALPQISYRKTLDARSLDENVNKVVQFSKGKYVWIFGDDDLIVEGALDKVINHLIDFSPDILILNSLSFDKSGVIEDSRTVLENSKNYGPTDNDIFLMELGGYLTYVGGIVIRRELWVKYFRSEMVGSYFAHIDAVCTAKVGRTATYIADPCIQMRLHNQTWTSKHYQIWNILFPKTIWGLSGYSEFAKSSVTPQILINSLKAMLSSRAYGRFNTQIYGEVIINCTQASRATKLFGLLIANLPQNALRLLYILYIKCIKNKRGPKFSPKLALAQLVKKY